MSTIERLANRVYHKEADVLMELCGYSHGLVSDIAIGERLSYLRDIGLVEDETREPTQIGRDVATFIYTRV